MNQSPSRRFARGLFSGLFILSLCISGNIHSVLAADGPSAASTGSPQTNSIEVPGIFKSLVGAKDAVTAKRPLEEIKLGASRQSPDMKLEIDASKGVATKPSKSPAINDSSKSLAINDTNEDGMLDFHATAYCLKGRTASGEHVRPGVIAADPRVLPIGTVVHLRAGRYTGTYTVLDTGARIKGRIVDVYVPNRKDAIEFGRRQVKIKVIGRAVRNNNPAQKSAVETDM